MKSKFYMGSYLIDCMLFLHPFPKLNCDWDHTKTPVYATYQILWAHKYSSYYNLVCEEFLMPLYELIFVKEPNCLIQGAMEVICVYGDYYFSKEGTYLRMYGGSRAPSLLLRYTTSYVVHKEVVRQLFIDGFENFLFDMKKSFFPPFSFYIGSYKFTKVKSAPNFVRELEGFHFKEKRFHVYTSSNKHAVDNLDTIFFDKKKEIHCHKMREEIKDQ